MTEYNLMWILLSLDFAYGWFRVIQDYQFDIFICLIELKGDVWSWRRYALY